jgi:hypothetical protein
MDYDRAAPQSNTNASVLASDTQELLYPHQTLGTDNANKNLRSTAIRTHPVKRTILDESSHQLEDVIKAVRGQMIPAGYSIPMFQAFQNTCLTKRPPHITRRSWVVSQHVALHPVVVWQGLHSILNRKDSRDLRGSELERIVEDWLQMNMALSARIASEINYQQYEGHPTSRYERIGRERISRHHIWTN